MYPWSPAEAQDWQLIIPPRPPHFAVSFRFSAARQAGAYNVAWSAAEKRKETANIVGGWPVVVNPPLRWGKPSGGGKAFMVQVI